MPEYKVFYFNVKALGEPLRFLLSYGNLPFEDVRISRNDWPALKPSMPMNQLPCLEVDGKKVNQSLACCRFIAKAINLAGNDDWENLQIDTVADTVNDFRLTMPMGQMPVLEVDGKRVHQSLAMCRYIAKQIGVAGKDAFEDLQIDALVDTINEFRLKIAIVSYEPDDAVKEKKMITLTQEVIPFYLTKMNVVAKENGGHLVLNRTTWADIYFAGIIDYLNYLTKLDLLENFPNLRQVVDNVISNENIQKYIAQRPVTEV